MSELLLPNISLPDIVLSAVLSSFFLVRIIKGSWLRNPQYLAISMLGAVIATFALGAMQPDLAADFIIGNITAFAGAFVAISAFDTALRSA